MKKEVIPKLIQPGSYENTLEEGGRVLLTLRLRWPRLEEDTPGLRRVNRYYDALADRWRLRWEKVLFEQAKAAPEPPLEPWTAALDFTVTRFDDGLFSLYLDAVENTGGRRPRRVRQGDVWRLPEGTPVTLRELLPPHRWWRGPVLSEIRRQIGGQIQAGESVYYDDWLRLVSRKFSPGRFYLTGRGVEVFYPVESIAPAMEGFPTFLLAPLQDAQVRSNSPAVST